ncbi:gamma-tubulin complex component 3 homolog isoform X1 [Dendronephthya gigantea]|uniref:gamma-tubulin complex component 3 homolog isoform X1 n=2 Tax=Dendronephthya gigantea TaxID=151771 RepID=UPI00106D9239|nr:gamma-tubulin complex component 3 homolog isoform X1 [Dendronephthya gigantea]
MSDRQEGIISHLVLILTSRLLQKDKKSSEVSEFFQYALRVLGSRFTSSMSKDEFQVVERMKRQFVHDHKEKDAALLGELYSKISSKSSLKNRWSILYLLSILRNKDHNDSERKSGEMPAFFGRGLPALSTSTPQQLPQTTIVPHGPSTGSSSGISSIPYTARTTSAYSLSSGVHSITRDHASSVATTLSRREEDGKFRSPGLKTVEEYRKKTKDNIENMSFEASDALLIRDLIYVFQGIDGKLIKFDQIDDGYRIDRSVGVPYTTRALVNKLSELGWLFNKIRRYRDARSGDKALGLVGQSFCAALQLELTEYYRLIAVFEAQQQHLTDAGLGSETCSSSLTFRRLLVWTYTPLLRLKTLAALVEICKGKKGGSLLSAIHSYMQHGNPYVKALVKHILNQVAQPIKIILSRWIYEGELDDAFNEFFVAADYSVPDERLWFEKYGIRKAMLPSFISLELGTKILNIGKSINFIHHVCHDRFTLKERKLLIEANTGSTKLTDKEDFGGTALQEAIDIAYKETSKYLLEILINKYKFVDHLKGMRRYLLLGQGDFIRHLMDLLEPDLAKPASTLYTHNLSGVLEAAIRATNAQFEDPDIIKRLDCRLLEVSVGDSGWDVFSLCYKVDGPIGTVFTPECTQMYLRIFNFLWRAKRMEYILTSTWKAQMSYSRLFRSLPELGDVLHTCSTLNSEMIHFINQMQYYITFEILECCWAELLKKVHESTNLDDIIVAHENFLQYILSSCLIDNQSKDMLDQLRAIFDQIIKFQTTQDTLISRALFELELRKKKTDEIKENTEEGRWGFTAAEEEREEWRQEDFRTEFLPVQRAQLQIVSQSYENLVEQFLLKLTSHSDVNLRFLSFRLDFNEHYKKKEPRLRSTLSVKYSRRKGLLGKPKIDPN